MASATQRLHQLIISQSSFPKSICFPLQQLMQNPLLHRITLAGALHHQNGAWGRARPPCRAQHALECISASTGSQQHETPCKIPEQFSKSRHRITWSAATPAHRSPLWHDLNFAELQPEPCKACMEHMFHPLRTHIPIRLLLCR